MHSPLEQLLTQAIQAHQQRQLDVARRLYQQVLSEDPEQLSALNNLGAILMDQGRLDEAERLLQRAVTLAPGYANAYNHLGMVFERRRAWDEAAACFQQALELNPNHAQASNNLGNVLKARGDLEQAARAYLRAHQLLPGEVLILSNLGNVLLELGQLADAERCFRVALQLEPRRAELHNNLGRVLQAADQLDTALLSYLDAQRLDPEQRPAYNNAGVILLEQNEAERAINAFSQALSRESQDLEARFNHALALPILYHSQAEMEHYRQRFSTGLHALTQELLTPPSLPAETLERLTDVLSRRTNFYLQYQGQDDRALQTSYAGLLERAAASAVPTFVPRVNRSRKRLRVGVVSALFRDHTVGKLMLGFLEQRDRSRFEYHTYYLGHALQPLTRRYEALSDGFRVVPARLQAVVSAMRADQLDVALFAETAMTPVLAMVAAARVAPVQALFWGHPVTSGLSTMELALTADDMEPPGGELHYREKLVRLPGVGVCYARPAVPPLSRLRADFGLSSSDVVYLSCQSLYKYLPTYDTLFPRIALEVPRARFVFLEHPRAPQITRLFKLRLKEAFAVLGLVAEQHCHFLPYQNQASYFALNQLADVFLDTPGWSGGNTTLEALATGLPVVTWPGTLMRARHAHAMVKALDLEALSVQSSNAYVALAVELGQDAAKRQALRELILERMDDGLFNRVEVVRALERALKEQVGLRQG